MVVDTLPDMMKECPICLEALFDEQGIAQNGEVAKIMCFHLVHSECLQQAGQTLNPDGKRYGIGGMGPRAGCPVCNRPVSMWIDYKDAAAFPIFWMKRILSILEMIGPSYGPVAVNHVLKLLKDDSTLTKRQKRFITRGRPPVDGMDHGLNGALKDGDSYFMWEEIDGGIANGGSEKMYMKEMAWDWNRRDDTLWLYKWGPGNRNSSRTGQHGGQSATPTHFVLQSTDQFGSSRRQNTSPRNGDVGRYAKEMFDPRQWSLRQWVVAAIVGAVVASIYFDNGEEITW